MGLHKIIKIVALILALAGVVLAGMLISGNEGQIGNMLRVSYVTFAIVLIFVLLFTLQNLFSSPAALKSALMGIGSFAVVGLICYFVLANGVETEMRDGKILSASGSQLVGAGLYMFYALAVIACGAMLLSGVKKMIK